MSTGDRARVAGAARLIATVFGAGSVPKAPGTAGSLVGLLIALAWPAPEPPLPRAALMIAALLASVWACTRAERALRAHDPPQIVLDELLGMWLVIALMPRPDDLPCLPGVAFVLFRLFDIAKPPPLRRLARLPEGWGIVLDDVGAGLYALVALWALVLAIALGSGSLAWHILHRG